MSCARAGLKALVAKHNPQVGDAVAIAGFGMLDGKKYAYGMNVHRNSGGGDAGGQEPTREELERSGQGGQAWTREEHLRAKAQEESGDDDRVPF